MFTIDLKYVKIYCENVSRERTMKDKKDVKKSNKIKEIIMKTFILLAGASEITGIILGIIMFYKFGDIGLLYLLMGIIVIPSVLIGAVFLIGRTIKDDLSEGSDDYKIKYYNCTLEGEIDERMAELYGEVKYSEFFPENYYCTYRKEFEVVIIAVMYVDSTFSEDEFVAYMSEIPEVDEQILSHTLIVIFIEKEKSAYLHEIMYCPEYNSLYDTKIFSVYDKEKNKLKVNKTDSGTGDKAYNDARKVLNYIFTFESKNKS